MSELRVLRRRNERLAKSLIRFRRAPESGSVLDLLEASEKRFQALIEHSADVVILVDKEGTILYVSPSADRLYGLSREEPRGKNALEFVHPDDLRSVKDRFDQLVQQPGAAVSTEMRIWHKDGTWHWMEVTGTNLLIEPSVAAIVVNYHDIDKRKRAEEALAEERNFCLQVMNALGQGLTVTDPDGRFSFVNPAYAHLVGYETHDLIGKKPSDFTVAADHAVLDAERARRKRGEASSYENRLRHKDGREIPVQITSVPRWEKGAICGAIAIVVDLKEHKQLEEELRVLSLTDDLTGLYNRRGFLLLAEQMRNLAPRLNQKLSLLFLDVDGLKRINDALGHKQGDSALVEIAGLLRATFRLSDLMARVGGDEFVVLTMGNADENAKIIAARLLTNLEARNARPDLSFKLNVSIGIADYDPENPYSVDEWLARADALMYKQKCGKNR